MTKDDTQDESQDDEQKTPHSEGGPDPEFMADPPLVGDEPQVGRRGARPKLEVDYSAVRLPDGDYTEATVEERRAVLLDRIEQAGHPRALPYTYRELADEFDVSKSTIADDMSLLAEWCAQNVEREHVAIMDAVFRGAVLDLVRDGKRAWAAEVGREWFEWLADMGAIERVPEHVSLDATVRNAGDSTDEYEIVEDDTAQALRAEDGGASAAALGDGTDEPLEAETVEDDEVNDG